LGPASIHISGGFIPLLPPVCIYLFEPLALPAWINRDKIAPHDLKHRATFAMRQFYGDRDRFAMISYKPALCHLLKS
jgi:hypothetical protein